MKQRKNRFVPVFVLFICLMLGVPQKGFAQVPVCEVPGNVALNAKALDIMQKAAVKGMVTAVEGVVTAKVALIQGLYITPVVGIIDVWGLGIRQIMGRWSRKWIQNALLPMTSQMNTTKVDQTRNLGSTIEAENQMKAQREIQAKENESVKKFTPNEYTCVADSTARYSAEAHSTTAAIQTGMVTEISDMGMNTRGSAVDDGRAEGLNQRWVVYAASFCNNQANNGTAGCAAALPERGADVSVAKTLFRKETIDMANPVTASATKELVQNLASFEPAETIPPNTLNNVIGRESMLRQRRLQTQMNAVTGVLSGIVGERTPGSGTISPEVQAARLEAGVPASEISTTPSKRELRQTVIDKLWSPQFYRDLGDEPNTISQKEVYLKAYSNALLYDLIVKTEQVATLFAVQLGNMTDEVGTTSGAISARQILP